MNNAVQSRYRALSEQKLWQTCSVSMLQYQLIGVSVTGKAHHSYHANHKIHSSDNVEQTEQKFSKKLFSLHLN